MEATDGVFKEKTAIFDEKSLVESIFIPVPFEGSAADCDIAKQLGGPVCWSMDIRGL